MRKDIDPELYNYNRFPGPQFKRLGDRVEADDFVFTLLTDYREAFNPEVFSQRFSHLLLKFDYIVGDWSNDQLRLKGFYRDKRANQSWSKFSRLEEYLVEYCNFGAAYFVLENAHPTYPSKPFKPKKKVREWRDRRSQHKEEFQRPRKQSTNRHFSIRKKQESR